MSFSCLPLFSVCLTIEGKNLPPPPPHPPPPTPCAFQGSKQEVPKVVLLSKKRWKELTSIKTLPKQNTLNQNLHSPVLGILSSAFQCFRYDMILHVTNCNSCPQVSISKLLYKFCNFRVNRKSTGLFQSLASLQKNHAKVRFSLY